jgi:polysaccharide biosynthesis/export protein
MFHASVQGIASLNLQAGFIATLGLVSHHLLLSCPASLAQIQLMPDGSVEHSHSSVEYRSVERRAANQTANQSVLIADTASLTSIQPGTNTVAQIAAPRFAAPQVVAPQVVAQRSAQADAQVGAQAGAQYFLGSGDQVQVTVFNAPDYSGEFSVLAGGALNLPLAGEVIVEGLTLQQASEEISARLSQYVQRPRVTVSLLAARPLQVAIAGEVNRPGAYTLPLDGANGFPSPTLTQVVGLAGGITQSADIREITVQRKMPRGNEFAGEDSVVNVNLWELLREGQLDADLALQNGDRIIIPRAIALSPEESTELASTSFSPTSIAVNVVGEVENPGSISLPPNAPLNQAILSAGGFNRRARQSTVGLIRLNDNGTVTRQDITVDFGAGLNPDNNPALQPNDTIVVGTNGLNQVTDALGTILSPLNSGFGLFRLFGL